MSSSQYQHIPPASRLSTVTKNVEAANTPKMTGMTGTTETKEGTERMETIEITEATEVIETTERRNRHRAKTALVPCRLCGRAYRYRKPHFSRYHAEWGGAADEVLGGDGNENAEEQGQEDGGEEDEYEEQEERHGKSEKDDKGEGDKAFECENEGGVGFPALNTVPATMAWPNQSNDAGLNNTLDMRTSKRSAAEMSGSSLVNTVHPAWTPEMLGKRRRLTGGSVAVDSKIHIQGADVDAIQKWEKLLAAIREAKELSSEQKNSLVFELFREQIKSTAKNDGPPSGFSVGTAAADEGLDVSMNDIPSTNI